ncbi:lipoprotein signal peptidase [Paraliobacillus quinghaiensis]|uniref:Lipoprotein signal peptidase n=1 Tax=Paraliobacillus quinghaiensis TaxID=470815 RepID=A0A917WQ83_9BACI|nr:signal peptidase II [Paraliobacillus quinghaiensis]GGM20797.1 lipoprotein signal peptidase [Paraliobacillus quinghaiensis]
MRYYLLAFAIIVIDQLTKWWVIANMELRESITVIENFFYITSHRNTGAAWGILAGKMTFFYIITAVVIVVICYYIQKIAKDSALTGVALGLILGGAIGNFIDRLVHKEVVDFFDVYLGSYNYPIFNIADSALVVGVILVLIATLLDERNERRKKA